VTPELEKYYEERFTMFLSQGWKDLVEDAEAVKKAVKGVEELSTVEELWFAKGQMDILNWLLGIKDASEQAYKELTDA
jgi:hypothetical protein